MFCSYINLLLESYLILVQNLQENFQLFDHNIRLSRPPPEPKRKSTPFFFDSQKNRNDVLLSYDIYFFTITYVPRDSAMFKLSLSRLT